MKIKSIKLYNFRNLVDAEVEFAPGVNVIVGQNAQGKTNLVEAVHFLALTKSFRSSHNNELIRWGAHAASVFSTVTWDSLDADFQLGVSIERGVKNLYFNSEKLRSVTEYLGKLIAISFSPTDISLVKGPPTGRRSFIDKHLVDLTPSSISHLMSYQRALNNKSALLKEGVSDLAVLESWNIILAREAYAIARARQAFITQLQEVTQNVLSTFAPADGELQLSLESNILTNGELSEQSIIEKLKENAARESQYRSCLIGPHRDDLEIKLAGQDARAFASQGQARSIVLALTIGVLELLETTRGESPVVLLDDVNSELDAARSEALFTLVVSQERQIFITGTDASVGHLKAIKGFNNLRVVCGQITKT